MSSSDGKEHLSSSVRCGDHFSVTVTRQEKIIAFSESEGRGRAASADAAEVGRLAVQLTGTPPRGEDGTLDSCQRLVDHLNSTYGDSWGAPTGLRGAQHIDAEVVGVGPFAGRHMTIQVVRALTDPTFWRTLGYCGDVLLSFSLSEAADLLKCAIEHKLARIPPEIRMRLTLVLDAMDVPGLSLDPVIDNFNLRHGVWAEEQGFQAVWVIGPRNEMVRKLCRIDG